MTHLVDETGNEYNGVVVLERFSENSVNGKAQWKCLCECGNQFVTIGSQLRQGRAKSCGCKTGFLTYATKHEKHGGFGTAEYQTWCSMITRCYCETNKAYHYYGGRGIIICDRWRNSFKNFLEDMGKRPDRATLDRIDNDGPYSPDNCRWASRKEQANNRRTNRVVSHDGKTMTLSEWSDVIGIRPDVIKNRLNHGWPIEDALSPTKRRRGRRRKTS